MTTQNLRQWQSNWNKENVILFPFLQWGAGFWSVINLTFTLEIKKRSPQYNSKVAYCHHMGKPIILVFIEYTFAHFSHYT